MGNIVLTNSDKVAIISPEDYEQVSKYRWFLKHNGKGGYYVARSVRIGKKIITVLLHRFIMQPENGQDVHHKDGDKLNCKRGNLECVDHFIHGGMRYNREEKEYNEYMEKTYG